MPYSMTSFTWRKESDSKRLVVPSSCRSLVFYLAHTIPWAVHLGHCETYLRVASQFFWYLMYTDVQAYYKTCPECQKPVLSVNQIESPSWLCH